MTFSVLELLGLIVTVAVVTTLLLVLLVMFWPTPKPGSDRHRAAPVDRESGDAMQVVAVLSTATADTSSSCNSDSSAGSDSSASSSCD